MQTQATVAEISENRFNLKEEGKYDESDVWNFLSPLPDHFWLDLFDAK